VRHGVLLMPAESRRPTARSVAVVAIPVGIGCAFTLAPWP